MSLHTGSLRESIEGLEKVKERIVDFWNSRSDMDDAQRTLWIGDTREMYYLLVSAWVFSREEFLQENEYPEAIQFVLRKAKSRLEQVASELNCFPNYESMQLEQEMREAFEKCWKPLAVDMGIKELFSRENAGNNTSPVIPVSDLEYHLRCTVCGTTAYLFKIDRSPYGRENRLVYKGITHSGELSMHHARQIFAFLERKDVPLLHQYLIEAGEECGIDAYCPDCDKIYCDGHYQLTELWDAGLYDCSHGTCPEGHHRKIDD